MLTQKLIEDYYFNTFEINNKLCNDQNLFNIIRKEVASSNHSKLSNIIINDEEIHEVFAKKPELIRYLKDGEEIQLLLEKYPKPSKPSPKDEYFNVKNQQHLKYLLGHPDFISCVYKVDKVTPEEKILFNSLIDKVEDCKKRIKEGSLLPLFFISKNRKSGHFEVEQKLNDDFSITYEESIKSIEDVLLKIDKNYTSDSFPNGFLLNEYVLSIKNGENKDEQEDEEKKKEVLNGFELLFNYVNYLNFDIFKYVLWIITGKAQEEIERLLKTFSRAIQNLIENKISNFKLINYGHVQIIRLNKKNISKTDFLLQLGNCLVKTLLNIEINTEEDLSRSEYLLDLFEDKDIKFEYFLESLNDLDFYKATEILNYCISEDYLYRKKITKTLLREIQLINEGKYFKYEFFNEYKIKGIRNNNEKTTLHESVNSLYKAICDAFKIRNPKTNVLTFQYKESELKKGILAFSNIYSKFKDHKPFQQHIDFNAAFGELTQKNQSFSKEFLFSYTPLSEFLKIILQRRYDELNEFLEIINSYEYSLLTKLINNLLQEFNENFTNKKNEQLFPDPLIIKRKDCIDISFSETHFHKSFNDFAECLALQIYGYVTGKNSFNDPSILLYEKLEVKSSIDNFISGLWDHMVNSVDAIINLLYDLQENLVEYMIQYLIINKTSKVKEVTFELKVKPTRDSGIFSKWQTKILIVEDNLINQKIMMLSLKSLGCVIDIANNGKEALDKLKSTKYEIILMDIQMPVMNGLETTKKIREIEGKTTTPVPIIAVTANALSGDKETCIAAGMNDYISKPFQVEVLTKKILDALAITYPSKYAELSM